LTMKTFASNYKGVAVSCVFFLVSINFSLIGGSKIIAKDSSPKINLRSAVGIHQQNDVRLNSSTRQRRVAGGSDEENETETTDASSGNFEVNDADNETEELEEIEKEFGNEDEETEELENIEKEFGGGNNDVKQTINEEQSTSTIEQIGNTETEEVDEFEFHFTPETTVAPVVVPINKPSPEYNTINGDYDPIKAEDEKEELVSELKQEEKVARRAGGLGIFFGLIAMIFTAHQMSENPDGIYASVCRLAITISSVIIKIVCMPCRKLIGSGNGHPYSGHMPVSTSDYSYRNDPYRSNANAGFEMK